MDDPDAKGCGGEEPGGLTYTVDLVGPDLVDASVRGAFEFDIAGRPSAAPATLDRGALNGAGAVTMTRPAAMGSTADKVWNDVFNLCGLLGPFNPADPDPDDGAGPTNVNTFDVEAGGWEVAKGGGRIWLSLGFTILASDNPATTRDLSASLQLTGPCNDPVNVPSCEDTPLIPTEAGSIDTDLINASIHLRGRGGVTHQAVCHTDDDELLASFSNLVITAN